MTRNGSSWTCEACGRMVGADPAVFLCRFLWVDDRAKFGELQLESHCFCARWLATGAVGHAQCVGGQWEQILCCFCAVSCGLIVQNSGNFNVKRTASVHDDCHFGAQSEHHWHSVGACRIQLARPHVHDVDRVSESSVSTVSVCVLASKESIGLCLCIQRAHCLAEGSHCVLTVED